MSDGGQRLLVVDDDAGMCRAMVRVLGSRYRVETAQSTAEAHGLPAGSSAESFRVLDTR